MSETSRNKNPILNRMEDVSQYALYKNALYKNSTLL
jgi:hypothetical protein